LRSTTGVPSIDVPTPTFQRAPGESTGTFALETAMDGLAYALAIDPVELRIRNRAARDEQHDPHQLVGSSALDDKLERPAPHRVVSEANYPGVKR